MLFISNDDLENCSIYAIQASAHIDQQVSFYLLPIYSKAPAKV